MKKILIIILLLLVSCNIRKTQLTVHKTDNDDGDIFGDPKIGFFSKSRHTSELFSYNLNLKKEECQEIKRLLKILKTRPVLDNFELGEEPKTLALIIKKDTLYSYGNGWYWKRRAVIFESQILDQLLNPYLQ